MATFPIKGLPPLPGNTDYDNIDITSASGANWDSATPFSVNTWQELIASTEENWAGFIFNTSQQYGGIISFAVGSAGNEVKIADLYREGYPTQHQFHVPIAIPAGSRLSIHYHNNANSVRNVRGSIIPQLTSDVSMNPPYTRLDVGPFQFPAGSGSWGQGTLLDPGGVAHTWSPWTEITQPTYTDNVLDGSSIPYQYKWLGVSVQRAGGTVSKSWAWQIAIGSAGQETIILEWGSYKQSYTANDPFFCPIWIKWDRPPGDRISARSRCNDTDPSRRLSWVHLWGLL